VFTDALYPLSSSLDSYTDRTLYVVDWGIYENLNLLHEGRLSFHVSLGPLSTDSPSPEQLDQIREMLRDPGGLILDHVREREVFPSVGARLDRAARALGYRREIVSTVPDSNGRPMFEIVRFVPDLAG